MSKTGHRAFVRKLPCLVCSRSPCHAAHVRYSDKRFHKVNPGMGRKPHDRWCVPLCFDCHLGVGGQHSRGERQWWKRKGINPLSIAQELWDVSGDYEKGRDIVRHAFFDLGPI